MSGQSSASGAAKAAAYPLLTGARGLAILWVVFVHLPLANIPDWLDRIQHRFGIGVDFFLAASGFLVTRSLLQCDRDLAANGRRAVAREFLLRRFARILPSYYAMLALVFLLAMVDGGLRARLIENIDILWSYPLFFSNYSMTSVMERAPAILNMTWSLSYQEQFYAVLVLAYAGFSGRKHLGPLLLALGVLSACSRMAMVLWIWQPEVHSAELTMWTHLRFDAVAWSALAFIYYERLSFLWATAERARVTNILLGVGLGTILVCHAYLSGDFNQALLYCAKAPLLALIVRALARPDALSKATFARMLLSSTPMVMIGVAAYEIYLLNPLAQAIVLKLGRSKQVASLPMALTIYAVSVLGGLLMYRYFGRLAKYAIRSWLATRPLGNPTLADESASR